MAPPVSTAKNAPKQNVVIKVKSAALKINFESLGAKMDPFAKVEWKDSLTGDKVLLSRTATEWNAGKNPQWDHACRGHPYGGKGSGEAIEISVWEDELVMKPKFMGVAEILVEDLLDSADHVLDLVWKKGEITGTVTVEAFLVEQQQSAVSGGTVDIPTTRVDPEMFVRPVKRLGVSGGTAPFFALTLSNPKQGQSASHYIGKDLSRAVDEVVFYEEILQLKEQDSDVNGLKDLLDFAFEYKGVLKAPESGVADTEPELELLVLRNLRDGCETLRLLDLKMGQKTASANWQGKSRKRAMKQSLFDKSTNSFVEGYRLEGFDGKPESLKSMDPLMDLDKQKSEKSLKKAGRLMLQSMTGSEIFMHFLDLHFLDHYGSTVDSNVDLAGTFGAAELGEIVMHEIVRSLTRLAAACQLVKVPQKWVGSSVALGYDSGLLPSRSKGEGAIRDTVLVNVFDWGRSELNTVAKEQHLSADEQQNRKKFWGYYKGGIEHLAWVAAQTYLHRFGNCSTWKEVTLTVYDFDAMTKDDSMGSVSVPVKETPLTQMKLHGSEATLSFSIHWRACPTGSRLKGTWRVFIEKAEKLPNKDTVTLSDPYCMITAISTDDNHRFEQVSTVVPNDLNPVWRETLDLPVAALEDALETALEEGKSGLGSGDLHGMMSRGRGKSSSSVLYGSLSLSSSRNISSSGFSEWSERLQQK